MKLACANRSELIRATAFSFEILSQPKIQRVCVASISVRGKCLLERTCEPFCWRFSQFLVGGNESRGLNLQTVVSVARARTVRTDAESPTLDRGCIMSAVLVGLRRVE